MRRFRYIFGYETPQQARNNVLHGWDDEDSHAVVIIAPSEDAALQWGREISERFIALLFGDPAVSWKASGYAHWIENQESGRFATEYSRDVPVVEHGEFPDFHNWLASK